MIIVEIDVPTIQKTYDFMLDENITVYSAIEEIAELICQKEGFKSIKNSNEFRLFSCTDEKLLRCDKTLAENSVDTGNKLIFV